MPDPHRDREAFLKTLPMGALPATLSAGQTITPLAYARTAVESPEATLGSAIATTPPHALPRITLGDAPAAEGAEGSHDLQILRVLGEGGMGVVSLAMQRSLRREVAVKTVRSGDVDARCAGALLHEAVVTGSLEHPTIVPVHALGTDASGRPVMVMKRIEGTCWRDLLADPKHPAWADLAPGDDDRLEFHLEILEHLCNALHFAHRRGFVHRDLKPENVMIGSFGEVYLLDWGIATKRRSREQAAERGGRELVGTPAYMAPEMITHEECTERTDVYLLGATLHEVLTGRPRHDGVTIHAALAQALESLPYDYDPSVPAELAALCNRATAADPAARPESALSLRQALREFRRHRSSVAAARAALDRLAELEPLLDVAKHEEPVRLRVHKLFAECRFGLMHALREWPENPAAREGIAKALTVMAAHELDRGNPDSAEALLAEMEEHAPPPPALRERLAAAREQQRREVAEAERLRGLARDHDPRVGGRARGLVIAATGVLGLGITAFVFRRGHGLVVHDHATALKLIFAYAIGLVALVYVFRRRVLANRVGRVLAGLFGSAVALMVVHRAGALASGEPIPMLLGNDMLILASGLLGAGIAVQRVFLWFGLVSAGLAATVALLPQHALVLFSLGAVVAIPVGWLSWKSAAMESR